MAIGGLSLCMLLVRMSYIKWNQAFIHVAGDSFVQCWSGHLILVVRLHLMESNCPKDACFLHTHISLKQEVLCNLVLAS